MILIELKLFVTLAKYLPQKPEAYPVGDGTTVGQLIKDLGIPDDIVKLIFVNGRKQERSYCLCQGDRVGIFPPVGGG